MTTQPHAPDMGEAAERPTTKWFMLALVCVGFVVMTLCWFNISGALTPISDSFGLSMTSATLLVSLFTVAYGVFHIPGGLLMTRFGIRPMLAISISLEGLGAALAAVAPNFGVLLAMRILCAIGASMVAVVGMAAISAWFPKRQIGLCFGIASAAFMLGATAGLDWWADVVGALGWRAGLGIAGLLCLAVGVMAGLLYRIPRGATALEGVKLTRRVVRETAGNPKLWIYALAFVGSYSGYYAGAQLMSTYGTEERQFDASAVSMAAMLVGLAGVPGALIGGWVTDRLRSRRAVFCVSSMSIGGFLMLFPAVGQSLFWLPAFGIAFMFNFAYTVWATVPATTSTVSPENVGTAVGMMLSIAAIVGFIGPYLFGLIVPAAGYTLAWAVMGGFAIVMSFVALADRTSASADGDAGTQRNRDEAGELEMS
ncbi:MFS transporter [Mycolicibacterium litorale]|uniref:MFS transporter n=1 Tax=Mycolicibacterium litorale TaxID=758802 RepID=UPI003CF06180